MEEKRAKTLEALQKFIDSQQTMLERTNADIERLKELRKDVASNKPDTLEDIGAKLYHPAFRLSEQLDAMPPLPKEIDWSVFDGADPTPFRIMAANAREAYAARQVPPKTPLGPPSSLRQFVIKTRASIVDPVLSTFRLPEDLAALSSDDEPDPAELRRAREREKIRELKKRRIEGDAGAAAFAGLGLRKPVAAVFIRRDQEDESADVDMSMDGDDSARSVSGCRTEAVPIAVDTPGPSAASPVSITTPIQEGARPSRERRPTRKAQTETKGSGAHRTKVKAHTLSKFKPDDTTEPTHDAPPPHDKNGKAKSETYKRAWSVSEQHLLERLLEEIPDGEKNRWAKISKAMNGRRTARQVASRVQKYYEKLKRFGVEVGGSKGGGGAAT